jgi:hypothetical protein
VISAVVGCKVVALAARAVRLQAGSCGRLFAGASLLAIDVGQSDRLPCAVDRACADL